jgi:2-polyprenyl-6-methoxyphenol hydroxylase-like FAD-dependent oxidoreductase
LRAGRIFIAGDTAHIHSPIGGQGMNTGLHDVWNLTSKRDFALRGCGDGAQLLDTYSAKRLPIIRGVIETTRLMTEAMATPSKIALILRDSVIPMVSHLAPFQHFFVRRLYQFRVTYEGRAKGRRTHSPRWICLT